MNDRFKFRVWDKINDIWVKNFSIDENGYVEGFYNPQQAMNRRLVLMQCTGLKDKNGKLIYEGDILQQPQLPHKVVCEWYKDGFWLNGFMNGAKRELRDMHNWYEVIGNIYQNPELLEEE